MDFLLANPFKIIHQRRLILNSAEVVESFSQLHFTKAFMQAGVALSTDINTRSKLRFAVVFFEKRTTMHFLWDQVMKSEKGFALA